MTAFIDVAVVPTDRERVLEHRTVLVRDGRIERVGPVDVVDIPPDAVRINGRNRYLIPGPADMHVHLVEDQTDNEALGKLFLANGVTTVLNLRGGPEHLELRDRFASGKALGPRLYTSGEFVNEPVFRTPDEVEPEVIAHQRAGYDFIKTHGEMSPEAYARLIEVPNREGIRVIGHAPRNLPIDVVLDERQYAVVHIKEFMYVHFGHQPVKNPQSIAEMDRGIEPLARRVAKAGTWVTPTLVTYRTIAERIEDLESVLGRAPVGYVPLRIQKRWLRPDNTYTQRYGPEAGPSFRQAFSFQKRLFRAFHAVGVPLLAGTDASIPSVLAGFPLHQALQIMVDAGLLPYAALVTATRNPAAFVGASDEFGTIEQGMQADLLLLDANPLEDISASNRIAGVMLRGLWLQRARLDSLLDEAAAYAGSPAIISDTRGPVTYYGMLSRAQRELEEGRFSEAAASFARLADANPRNGSVWLNYGTAAQSAGQETAALRAYERAYELGVSQRELARRIAALLARQNDHDGSIAWLERAVADRWLDRSALWRDSTFEALRGDSRFAGLAGQPAEHFTRNDGWRHDLEYLVQQARRLHKDIARPAFSSNFDAAVRRLQDRIPDLTDAEIVWEMERILTLLNDGHTRIIREAVPSDRLPLDLYLFSDGLYVVSARQHARDLIGSQILSFGRLRTEQLFEALEAWVPRDNPMGVKWVGPHYVTDPVLLKLMGATNDTTAVALTIRDRSRSERRVTVHPVPTGPDTLVVESDRGAVRVPHAEPRLRKLGRPPTLPPDSAPLFLQRVDDPFWLAELRDADAVYFQYNQVFPVHKGETVAEFAERLQQTLEQSGARNLIVDVRHNSGGKSATFPPLVRTLAWFSQTSPEHRIYLLIGRMTFSAAQNFTNIVATLIDPVFVGEPTGSKPNFVGQDGGFRLPHSGVTANVSFRTHQGTIWDDDAIWIAPDVPVEMSSHDYFAGRDPVLEATRALILAQPLPSRF